MHGNEYSCRDQLDRAWRRSWFHFLVLLVPFLESFSPSAHTIFTKYHVSIRSIAHCAVLNSHAWANMQEPQAKPWAQWQVASTPQPPPPYNIVSHVEWK